MNSKIALLIHGHVRNYEQTVDNLKELYLDKYKIDIFIHTWTKRCWKIPEYKDTNIDVKHIVDLYKSKGAENVFVEVEGFDEFTKTDILYQQYHHINYSTIVQYIKLKKANNLRKDIEQKYNHKYEFCIKYRPDVILHKSFEICKEKNSLSFVRLDVPRKFCIHDDKFFFGPCYLFDELCEIIQDFSKIIKPGFDTRNLIHPHHLVDFYCKWKKIPFKYIALEKYSHIILKN